VEMDSHFGTMYSAYGHPSIPPKFLLRALLLQVFYSARSQRQLIEQLNYNLLFRWFVGLGMDEGDGSDFRGQTRSNETHASVTDPDARLYKKAPGEASRMANLVHVLMDNRHGLIAGEQVTTADGTAEVDAAVQLVDDMGEPSTSPSVTTRATTATVSARICGIGT